MIPIFTQMSHLTNLLNIFNVIFFVEMIRKKQTNKSDYEIPLFLKINGFIYFFQLNTIRLIFMLKTGFTEINIVIIGYKPGY